MALKLSFAAMGIAFVFQTAGWFQLVCIFVPISMGIVTAGVYCLCIAWPVDNGFVSNPQDSANFVLGNSIGEGLLLMPLGYSMQIFGFEAFMAEVFLFSFLCYWCFREASQSMAQDHKNY